ncbi:prepilin peptidase [Phytopseudomonas punonensis]|uniref:Prepilin peptidase CpaA n=1 Tax=Phytopseudomonas punonensis TaxID=1220495 RepID=A0A1M7AK93_9GAMM|nr:prepilin peptidase [Pseudomonas punonensis]SHL43077.1 prepilin peptidase CpaA [Pseudomonas punonensis]
MSYFVLLGWLGACALQDAQQRKISNLLTLGGLGAALLFLLASGSSLTGAPPPAAAIAMGVACLLSLPGYLTRQMGAADVKMLLALGAASDASHVLFSVIGAALVQVSWLVLVRVKPSIRLALPEKWVALRAATTHKAPYAPFLFAGFALTGIWL